jgi:hypothetical protein
MLVTVTFVPNCEFTAGKLVTTLGTSDLLHHENVGIVRTTQVDMTAPTLADFVEAARQVVDRYGHALSAASGEPWHGAWHVVSSAPRVVHLANTPPAFTIEQGAY